MQEKKLWYSRLETSEEVKYTMGIVYIRDERRTIVQNGKVGRAKQREYLQYRMGPSSRIRKRGKTD